MFIYLDGFSVKSTVCILSTNLFEVKFSYVSSGQIGAVCQTANWNSTGRLIAGTANSYGTQPTRLRSPSDIAFDTDGSLYVTDTTNDRIQKFPPGSTTGTTLAGLTVVDPTGIYATNSNVLYIVDSTNYRVLRWSNNVSTIVAGGNANGNTLNKMSTSYALYIDRNFNIYVSDYGNHRVTFWIAGNTATSQIVRITVFFVFFRTI